MSGALPQRARLLLLTRNLPPLQGGMERLNWHLLQQLQRVADVQTVGPQGAAALAPPGASLREAPLRPLWRFMLGALWHTLALGMRYRPNIYLAGSGLTAPPVWLASRLFGGRCVGYLHGLDISVDNAVYRRLWLPVLRRLDRVVVNSRATATLAIEAGIAPARIHIVHPGTTLPGLPDADRRAADARAFRQRHGLGTGPIMLSVGRLTRRKGLLEFVRDELPRVLESHPQATLVVVGGVANQALGSEALSPAQVLASAPPAAREQVRFLGELSDEELSIAMHTSTVHVFPVRSHPTDPEGFGMVAIEAAAHGLGTVAYASGGVADAVADGISGALVEPGDSIGFARAVVRAIGAPLPAAPMQAFATGFGWDAFGRQIRDVLGLASNHEQ